MADAHQNAERNDIRNEKIIENSALFFLFLVIEIKCIPRADGDEF